MFKKLMRVTLAAVAAAMMALPAAAQSPSTDVLAGRGPGGGSGGVDRSGGQGAALTPLSAAEKDGLILAIQEEYRARDLYLSVIDAFGDVTPFNAIARSEQQHVSALVRQAQKYGVAVPPAATTDFPSFDSLAAACQAGVDAEIADAALYDELLAVTTRADLVRVYTNLQRVSLKAHLPAFEACN